jgi:hypothetical protein
MFTKGNNQRFFFSAQNCRARLLGTNSGILHISALLPLGNSVSIDTTLFRQASYARLRSLDCATDCRCRSGAAM